MEGSKYGMQGELERFNIEILPHSQSLSIDDVDKRRSTG